MKGHTKRPVTPGSVPEQYAAVGTDDKDLPGGIPHVQPQTVPDHPPLDPGPPRDYYRGEMAGGVPVASSSNGKPKQDRFEMAANMATGRPDLVPELNRQQLRRIPIPVTIIAPDSGTQPLSRIACFQILVKATGFTPLVARDLKRTHVTICNEDSSNAIRFAQSGIASETGFYLPKASQSPRFACQDTVWAWSPSGSAVYVSLMLEYGIAEGQ